MAIFEEREITAPVNMCDDNGILNPAARGWARFPHQICNMPAKRQIKKKWNFWLVTNEEFSFCATIGHVGDMGVASAYVLDYKSGELYEDTQIFPRGIGIKLADTVETDVVVKNAKLSVAFTHTADTVRITATSPSFHGRKLNADITLAKPPTHETLNVIVPWTDEYFHFTSKQNTLPATGTVTLDEKIYEFKPLDSFGVLDFGRGYWKKGFVWNWGVFNHRQDGKLIGMNIGGKWTDGTGSTENGFCVDGVLYKISEDLEWQYDTTNFRAPWTIKTPGTGRVNLVLTPLYEKSGGAAGNQNNQMFGHFDGTIIAGPHTIEIRKAFGWAEQVVGNW